MAGTTEEPVSEPIAPSEPVKSAPRPRVKMLPKPDDSEVKAQTSKLNDEIQAQKKRIDEIRDIINNKQNGRQGRSGEQQGLKNRLVELKTQFQGELVSLSVPSVRLNEPVHTVLEPVLLASYCCVVSGQIATTCSYLVHVLS